MKLDLLEVNRKTLVDDITKVNQMNAFLNDKQMHANLSRSYSKTLKLYLIFTINLIDFAINK